MDNSPALDVTPGILSDGTAATLIAVETVLNNGENVTVTGETTQLTVTIGTTSMTVDLLSGSNAVESANQLVTLINMFQLYSAVISSGSIVRASSIRAEVTEDITVTVSRIGTAGTIQVLRTQVQDGVDPSVDFSTTVWTYYTINQEVRVDDDTTETDDNNNIMVRRGLINDVQAWDDISQIVGPNMEPADINIAYFIEPFTSGPRSSQAVFSIDTLTVQEFTSGAAANINMNYRLQTSVDNGMTWVDAINSFRLPVRTVSGLTFTAPAPINFSNMFALTASTEYRLRLIRRFTNDAGTEVAFTPTQNFLVNALLLEELLATP